ncbi:MAG: hypothetical protein VXY34_10025 [Bdellovibrionota bacterium]|nr:hypothetical protein [Bdellovibrionota bacterium]MEC8625145.1 hypothetical protein [Bdellovibrionota bacterium]
MKKKSPSDYPTLSFRLSSEAKDELTNLIEKAVKKANKHRSEDDYVIKKNDVIIDALKIGLERIIKKNS